MKKYFIAGILVWIPIAITVWVITWGLGLIDQIYGSVMSALITVLPGQFSGDLKHFREIPGLGILIVLVVISFTGLLAISFAGQWWLKVWDRFVTRIPIVRSIYSSVKQVSSTIFSGNGQAGVSGATDDCDVGVHRYPQYRQRLSWWRVRICGQTFRSGRGQSPHSHGLPPQRGPADPDPHPPRSDAEPVQPKRQLRRCTRPPDGQGMEHS